MTDLTKLAEHYAKTLIVETGIQARVDAIDADDVDEADPTDILDSYTTLTEKARDFDGKTVAVHGVVSIIREDGLEVMIPIGNIKAEEIDDAMVCLAAQFSHLYAESYSVMSTFAGLERLQKHLAEEAGK